MAEKMSRGQLEDLIREKAYADPNYRADLVANPKKVLANHLTEGLPVDVEVKIVEENSKLIYLSIPPKAIQTGDELSEDDLKKVAGGFLDTFDCKASAALSFASSCTVSI
jgi:hypothetical protein